MKNKKDLSGLAAKPFSTFFLRQLSGVGAWLLLSGAFLLVGCSAPAPENTGSSGDVTSDDIVLTQEQMTQSDLKTGRLTDTIVSTLLPLTGFVDVPPGHRYLTGTYFSGKVASIHVNLGQQLRKGDALLSLENPEFLTFQQDYLEAAGTTAALRQDYERQQTLAAGNVASQKELQAVSAAWNASAARLSALEAKLQLLQIDAERLNSGNLSSLITLRAPVSGVVAGIAVTGGQWLNPETTAVELVDLSQLQLRMEVFEKDLAQIKKGQKVQITVPGKEDQTFTGTISQISPQIGMDSRSAGVIAAIDSPWPESLRPGMFVRAGVAASSLPVQCLPSTAVAEADDTFYVLQKTGTNSAGIVFRKVEVMPRLTAGSVTALNFIDKPLPEAEFLLNGVFQLIQSAE